MYEYLFGSMVFFVIWVIFYFLRNDLRNQMVFSSFLSLPLGALEVLFIPYYWNPQRLFNFNPAIESFVLMFCVGGIVSVLYEVVFMKKLENLSISSAERKRLNRSIGAVIVVSIVLLSFIFKNDFIYTFSITMFLGTIAIFVSRRYLFRKIVFSGAGFLLIYFLFLLFINIIAFPGWIQKAWVSEHLSGVFLYTIPIEEILWAFSFGLFWSTLYQILRGYRS